MKPYNSLIFIVSFCLAFFSSTSMASNKANGHGNGEAYKLLQITSEHRVNGESFPLEAHFVRINSENQLAVVGVIFKPGNNNRPIQSRNNRYLLRN